MNYILKGGQVFKNICLRARDWLIPSKTNDYCPHLLHSKVVFYAVVSVLIFKILSTAISLPLSGNFFFADITKIELTNLLNQTRQDLGLAPLVENEALNNAAMLKAQDMVAKGYFAHQSPDGVNPWSWFAKSGYNYRYAGENLAIGFIDSKIVYDAWLNSPSHKANLLDSHYTEVGTAIVSGFGDNDTTVVVQLFGSPMVKTAVAAANQTPQPETKPKPVPAPILEPEPMPVPQTKVPEDVAGTQPETRQVLSKTSQRPVLSGPNSSPASDSFYFRFLSYINYDNSQMLKYATYILFLLIATCLGITMANYVHPTRHQVAYQNLALLLILGASLLLDKDIIYQILPHQIVI